MEGEGGAGGDGDVGEAGAGVVVACYVRRTLLTALITTGALLAVLIQISPSKRHEVLPTPNISQKEAIGTVGYSARLHAPAGHVRSTVTDFPNYHKWSTRVPNVDFKDYPLKAGSTASITVS
jgi:hypothetical protein